MPFICYLPKKSQHHVIFEIQIVLFLQKVMNENDELKLTNTYKFISDILKLFPSPLGN